MYVCWTKVLALPALLDGFRYRHIKDWAVDFVQELHFDEVPM